MKQTIAGSILLGLGFVTLALGLLGFLPYESGASTGLLMLVLIILGGIQLYLGIRKLRQQRG